MSWPQPGFFCRALCRGIVLELVDVALGVEFSWHGLACRELAYFHFGRGGEFAGESPASNAFGLLIHSPSFWIMAVLFGLGVSSTIGVYAMLPLYLVSERRIDLSWANTVVALSRSYGPILGIVGGWVSDRLGPKQTMVMSLTFTGITTLLVGLVQQLGSASSSYFSRCLPFGFSLRRLPLSRRRLRLLPAISRSALRFLSVI